MTAKTNACDAGRLQALLDDRLSPSEQAALGWHLDTCAACCQSLDEMAGGQGW